MEFIDWQGKQAGVDPNITLLSVDADFRQMFNLQLQEGRWYEENNGTDQHNYILQKPPWLHWDFKNLTWGNFFL